MFSYKNLTKIKKINLLNYAIKEPIFSHLSILCQISVCNNKYIKSTISKITYQSPINKIHKIINNNLEKKVLIRVIQ